MSIYLILSIVLFVVVLLNAFLNGMIIKSIWGLLTAAAMVIDEFLSEL